MRKNFLVLIIASLPFCLQAQESDLSGSWRGSLDVMGQKLPLEFHFEQDGDGWKGTADSPAQGAKGLTLKNILFNGLMASWEFEQIPAMYEGVLVGDSLKGNFTQSGTLFPLELRRIPEGFEEAALSRPQEPKPPFEYEELETAFVTESGRIKLAGTITKPKGAGPFPAVVLVSGSGPQNRNGEIMGHQPLWVIADYLTQQGIAVFRYDERGVGASEGDFMQATSYDLKDDAADAIAHLRKFPFVNQQKVGAIGHSEGGMIGWMLAAEGQVNFLIAVAPPVVAIDQFMEQQTVDVLRTSGASEAVIEERLALNKKVYATVKNTKKLSDLEENQQQMLQQHLTELGVDEEFVQEESIAIMKALGPSMTPWLFEFLKFSPESHIKDIQIPVYAAFGGKDIQVNAAVNTEALRKLVVEREDLFEIVEYPNLNHLFQTAETGMVSEYATIAETFNEKALADFVGWIKAPR